MGTSAANEDQAWLVSQIQSLRHKLKSDKRELMSMRAKYKSMLDGRGTNSSPDVWCGSPHCHFQVFVMRIINQAVKLGNFVLEESKRRFPFDLAIGLQSINTGVSPPPSVCAHVFVSV